MRREPGGQGKERANVKVWAKAPPKQYDTDPKYRAAMTSGHAEGFTTAGCFRRVESGGGCACPRCCLPWRLLVCGTRASARDVARGEGVVRVGVFSDAQSVMSLRVCVCGRSEWGAHR